MHFFAMVLHEVIVVEMLGLAQLMIYTGNSFRQREFGWPVVFLLIHVELRDETESVCGGEAPGNL